MASTALEKLIDNFDIDAYNKFTKRYGGKKREFASESDNHDDNEPQDGGKELNFDKKTLRLKNYYHLCETKKNMTMNTTESLKKYQEDSLEKIEELRKIRREIGMERIKRLEEYSKSHPLSQKEFEDMKRQCQSVWKEIRELKKLQKL